MESEAALTSILDISNTNPIAPGTPKFEALWFGYLQFVCFFEQRRALKPKINKTFLYTMNMNRHLYKTVILVLKG